MDRIINIIIKSKVSNKITILEDSYVLSCPIRLTKTERNYFVATYYFVRARVSVRLTMHRPLSLNALLSPRVSFNPWFMIAKSRVYIEINEFQLVIISSSFN